MSKRSIFLVVGFVYLLSEVFGGAVRFYLDLWGLTSLAYLPKLLVLFGLLGEVIRSIVRSKLSITFFFLVLSLVFLFIVGLIYTGNLLQVAFGAWLVVPLLYGVLSYSYVIRVWPLIRPYILFLWVLAVAGVVINLFTPWPWVGFTYELGGVQLEGSRAWSTGGYFRLPGFSRASYEAATQILLLGLALTFLRIRKPGRVLLWLLTGVGIAMTTTKTALGVWVFVSIFFLLSRIVPLYLLRPLPALLAVAGITLPLSSMYVSLLPSANSGMKRLFFSSFAERMEHTWFDGISHTFVYGNALLGRGLGGIGSPQKFFEPLLYSPADNLFVYLFGIGGFLGLALLLAYGFGASTIPLKSLQSRLVFLLTLVILLEGITVNVLESPFLAMAFGFTLRGVLSYLTRLKAKMSDVKYRV